MTKEYVKYVGGFLFSEDLKRVVLIIKNKPSFLLNHLNPVGGKVENGENIHSAMVREFVEEAGLEVNNWEAYTAFVSSEFSIDYFIGFGDVDSVKTVEEEEVIVVPVSDVLSGKYKYDDTFRGAFLKAMNYLYQNVRKEEVKGSSINKYDEHKAWYNMQNLHK